MIKNIIDNIIEYSIEFFDWLMERLVPLAIIVIVCAILVLIKTVLENIYIPKWMVF